MKLHPANWVKSYRRIRYRAKVNRLTSSYEIAGARRIYHYHIRKTGGTSMARMFMSLNGNDSEFIWTQLETKNDQLCICNDLIYTGWYQYLLEQGDYFYGFSHLTYDEISLPQDTFTFTCFREPAARVVSHYRMLQDMVAKNSQHPCMQTEAAWLGNSFEDFLDRIPRQHLQNQLFMFSEDYCIDQALERVRNLNFWMFTENFGEGVDKLNRLTGLNLVNTHKHRSNFDFKLSTQAKSKLQGMLEEEYQFLHRLQTESDCVYPNKVA